MNDVPPIIDWNEAMQQCGDDEEFLRELLVDLKTEASQQLTNIRAIIQNPTENPFEHIMRHAHMIKGAAANLMCHQLRIASLNLEDAARAAHNAGGTAAQQHFHQQVQAAVQEFEMAVSNYIAHLPSCGVN